MDAMVVTLSRRVVPIFALASAVGLGAFAFTRSSVDCCSMGHGKVLAEIREQDKFPEIVRLEDLNLANMTQEWGEPTVNRSVDHNMLRIGGVEFTHGVGTHAMGEVTIRLDRQASYFSAKIGVDDEVKGRGTVVFTVMVDGKKVYDSGVMKGGQTPSGVKVNLVGAKTMTLEVDAGDDGNSYDHADWADAVIGVSGDKTKIQTVGMAPQPVPQIAHFDPNKVGIHGPRVVGTTPGKPFYFRVPATGIGPLTFDASNLPSGLNFDSSSGSLSGSVGSAGEFDIDLTVHAKNGTATRGLRIVAGQGKLAQTPPMGWNSWNVWATAVDADKVRQAADQFVVTGLASVGYQYVNIDDAWEAGRDRDGRILANSKFPDMSALANYVHSKGLKLGIYSSPGPTTCGGYTASYQHEKLDADQYAAWGIDYLKYDWCSYGDKAKDDSLVELQKPYKLMRDCLAESNRDIVFSLCQYGMGDVWKWGARVGGNLWRTTGDITDSWQSMSTIGFGHTERSPFAGPGHWNDPDMLVVGKLGWGPSVRPTHLTPNEQITHISLWSMLAAPLLIGCDLKQIDQFTLDLLCNTEVIEIDQDPLGIAATRKSKVGDLEVWERPLFDGSVAIAFFNRGKVEASIGATWSQLGLEGAQAIRDLWTQRDLGIVSGRLVAEVPGHGTVLLKVKRADR